MVYIHSEWKEKIKALAQLPELNSWNVLSNMVVSLLKNFSEAIGCAEKLSEC